MKRDTVGTLIVGGGLAGLTAALSLARRGEPVTLFERAPDPGGRARTRVQDGFRFNVGPHALYRGGAGMSVLKALGIPVSGQAPPLSGAYALDGGRLHTLPVGMASLLTTGLVDLRAKADLAAFLARLPRIDGAALQTTSLADWLRTLRLRPKAQQVVEALARLTTYGVDVDSLSAGAAVRQLQLAGRSVLYLDGGWQSLVDALAAAAREAGVRVVTGARVAAVERGGDRGVTGVRLADGTRHDGRAVVVAAGPCETAALVEGSEATSLARWRDAAAPVFMASLDLGLSRLPRPRALFALGIDRPVYFSVHSATARLAPAGGALVHAAMYLGARASSPAEDVRAELEALVDLVQPGWREAVVHARFLPRLLVAHGLPSAAQGGAEGRPGAVVSDVPRLFIAGDWVGPTGLLADASLASARQAADAVLALPRRASSAA